MKLHFLLAALLAANSFSASAQQVKEKLNRAPVAVKTSQGILVSWRSLTSDAKDLAFDVYRNGKKVASAVSDVTSYLDANGKPGDTYRIVLRQVHYSVFTCLVFRCDLDGDRCVVKRGLLAFPFVYRYAVRT